MLHLLILLLLMMRLIVAQPQALQAAARTGHATAGPTTSQCSGPPAPLQLAPALLLVCRLEWENHAPPPPHTQCFLTIGSLSGLAQPDSLGLPGFICHSDKQLQPACVSFLPVVPIFLLLPPAPFLPPAAAPSPALLFAGGGAGEAGAGGAGADTPCCACSCANVITGAAVAGGRLGVEGEPTFGAVIAAAAAFAACAALENLPRIGSLSHNCPAVPCTPTASIMSTTSVGDMHGWRLLLLLLLQLLRDLHVPCNGS